MLTGFVIGDRGLGSSGDTHPAWMMAHALAGPYLVVGASAIGQLHLACGLPRDDAFVIRAAGPWLAVAMADGVGSRPFSRYGATYVAEALSALLLRRLNLPLKAVKTPQTPSRPLTPAGLAPPSDAETAEIRIGIEPGVASLVAGLEHWEGNLARKERPSANLPQAASIGWWPPEVKSEPLVQETRLTHEPAPAGAGARDRSPAKPPNAPSELQMDLLDIFRQAFTKTHDGLCAHAHSLGLELADLSCTALALLLNIQTRVGAVGQIGDGAILGLTAQGKVLELAQPAETDDPQATYALNDPNFQRYLGVRIIAHEPGDPFVAFYVMTDGLSGDLLYSPKPKALEDWAQKVDLNLRVSSSPAQAANGMLNWLATYVVRGSWDDRTLVVITEKERDDGNCHSTA